MQIFFLLLSTVIFLFAPAECKTFRRCEFAKELSKNGVPREFISNFVCLAEAVSSLDTSKVSNKTVSNFELGIFQIPAGPWCKKQVQGGMCRIQCEKLLDAMVADDIKCALSIFSSKGFQYWPRWVQRCKSNEISDPNKYLPNLINCGH